MKRKLNNPKSQTGFTLIISVTNSDNETTTTTTTSLGYITSFPNGEHRKGCHKNNIFKSHIVYDSAIKSFEIVPRDIIQQVQPNEKMVPIPKYPINDSVTLRNSKVRSKEESRTKKSIYTLSIIRDFASNKTTDDNLERINSVRLLQPQVSENKRRGRIFDDIIEGNRFNLPPLKKQKFTVKNQFYPLSHDVLAVGFGSMFNPQSTFIF